MSLRTILLCGVALIAALGLWLLLGERQDARALAPSPDGIDRIVPADRVVAVPARPGIARASRRADTVPYETSPHVMQMQPLPPPNTRLSEIFTELERMAQAGSPPAMCRLAFELQRCRRLPDFRKSTLASRLRVEESPLPAIAQQRTMQGILAAEARIAELERLCDDFPIEKTRESWKYELAAVEAGHAPSIARFVWRGPPRDLPTLETLDAWNVYRDRAPELLMRAVDAGEPGAYEVAGVAYERGQWQGLAITPKDPVWAAAYWMALERRASVSGAARFHNWWHGIQGKAPLTAEQVAQAQALSLELAAKLTRVPPEGLDFSHGTFDGDDGRQCEAP